MARQKDWSGGGRPGNTHALTPRHSPIFAASPLVALLALGVLSLAGGGCREDPSSSATPEASGNHEAEHDGEVEATLSPDAKPEITQMLREDMAFERHASDGGGRAWLVPAEPGEDPPAPIRAGEPHRFDIVYEAGPLGIAEGGMLFLQVSPFWEWDSPQIQIPDAPGYTELRTDAVGVDLEVIAHGQQLLSAEIKGRALREGEQIRLRFGAGDALARVDRYAERGSPIWLAVDGDGDGIRKLVPDPPRVDIGPHAPALLLLTLPSTARPGDSVSLTVAIVDRAANAGVQFDGEVVLAPIEGLELPERLVFESGDGASRRVQVEVREPGIYRVRGRVDGASVPLDVESNPLVVRDGISPILWGDLHGHSQLSDGTGTPEDYFRYARDIAALDVVALTDHDHWGMEFLDARPELWERIRDATQRFHDPGRLVTILGYEWTSWLHGHRHVLYFADDGPVLSSLDPRYENPDQLWAGLRELPAMTFAHHSAGGPIATNWLYPPDPELEPITEVASVHGSSEAADSPLPIYSAVRGNFLRDALDHGYRFGFIGSGDSHDGHPGLAQIAAGGGSGGLAAIQSDQHSREGVRDALRSRRVYATNGTRIWLVVHLDGQPMGARLLAAAPETSQPLEFEVVAPFVITAIELIRGHGDPESPPGAVVYAVPGDGARKLAGQVSVPALRAGEYLYLRVLTESSGAAWSSPFYCDAAPDPAQP